MDILTVVTEFPMEAAMPDTASPLLQIVYISNTATEFDDRALAGLLAGSRSRNARHGITGVLLHHRQCFVQCIEGPADAIERLLQCIRADSRHKNIIILLRRTLEQRMFAQWHMGCTHINDSQYLQLANAQWEALSNQLAGSHADCPGFGFLLAFWNHGRSNLP